MDNSAELGQDHIKDLQRKIEYANKATRQNEEQILAQGDFSAERAVSLGVEYAARKLELWMFARDLDVAEPDPVPDSQSRYGKLWTGLDLESQRLVEKALFEAQRGNLSSLKSYLADQAAYRSYEKTEISKRLKSLSDLIPESGDLVILPIPAWMDPRFNPDASQPPPDLQDRASDK